MPKELERYNKWMRREPAMRAPLSEALRVTRERPCSHSMPTCDDALKLKDEGNVALRSGNARKAIRKYKLSIDLMTKRIRSESRSESVNEWKKQRAVVYSNASQACLSLGRGDDTVRFATCALDDDSVHVKSMFRAAIGLCTLGRYDDAKSFVRAISDAGDDTTAHELSEKVMAAIGSHGSWVAFDPCLSRWRINAQLPPAATAQLKLPTFRLKSATNGPTMTDVIDSIVANVGGIRSALEEYVAMRGNMPTPLTSTTVVEVTAELLSHNVENPALMLPMVITACGIVGVVDVRDEATWRERPFNNGDERADWSTYVLGLCCLVGPSEGGEQGNSIRLSHVMHSSSSHTYFEAQHCGAGCNGAICVLEDANDR